MRVLGELAGATQHMPYALAVLDHARRLSTVCTPALPEPDRAELAERLAAIERLVDAMTNTLDNKER